MGRRFFVSENLHVRRECEAQGVAECVQFAGTDGVVAGEGQGLLEEEAQATGGEADGEEGDPDEEAFGAGLLVGGDRELDDAGDGRWLGLVDARGGELGGESFIECLLPGEVAERALVAEDEAGEVAGGDLHVAWEALLGIMLQVVEFVLEGVDAGLEEDDVGVGVGGVGVHSLQLGVARGDLGVEACDVLNGLTGLARRAEQSGLLLGLFELVLIREEGLFCEGYLLGEDLTAMGGFVAGEGGIEAVEFLDVGVGESGGAGGIVIADGDHDHAVVGDPDLDLAFEPGAGVAKSFQLPEGLQVKVLDDAVFDGWAVEDADVLAGGHLGAGGVGVGVCEAGHGLEGRWREEDGDGRIAGWDDPGGGEETEQERCGRDERELPPVPREQKQHIQRIMVGGQGASSRVHDNGTSNGTWVLRPDGRHSVEWNAARQDCADPYGLRALAHVLHGVVAVRDQGVLAVAFLIGGVRPGWRPGRLRFGWLRRRWLRGGGISGIRAGCVSGHPCRFRGRCGRGVSRRGRLGRCSGRPRLRLLRRGGR